MYCFKSEVLRRIIEEAGGPMYVIGLEIKGERRCFIYRYTLDGSPQYHLMHNGNYLSFPRLEYAQELVEALQSYVRAHCYQWQTISTLYKDITKHEREVMAHHLVLIGEQQDDGRHATGLAYFKGDGHDDCYYPLHLASHEQLLGLCWRNELTIQRFLPLLSLSALSPDYWQNPDRIACIEKFPGGYPAIIDLGDKASTK